jgi:hypothetical protein
MRATAEEKKARAMQALRDARQAVLEAAAAVPIETADTVFLGEWSAKDIVAHLTGWDYANMQAVQAILTSKLPAFYAHHDRDWRSFNAELVRRYRLERYEATIQAAWESHQALCDLLAPIPAEEFERDHGVRFRGYKVTIARLLAADSKDGQTHARQLRDFVSRG